MTCAFLFFSAFFPRWTLFLVWLVGAMPANSTPFIVDVLCAWFCPRGLIAYWLYEAGGHPLLIGLFAFLQLCEWFNALNRSTDSGSESTVDSGRN